MRYSIFEYSQEKLISFGLDITDALLLNWFANFFCGRMEKQIFKDENGNSKVFGWIKTSKIIEDLPVLEITSEKGIQKRLNAFVEKGLLERQILNTQKGKKSYYRTTILYESLINTSIKQNEEKKDNSAKLNHANKTESNVSSQSNSGYHANKTESNASSQGNSGYHADKTESNESSQSNSGYHAQSNCGRHPQGNSSYHAISNSLINDNLIKDTAANILACTEKHFGQSIFDSEFDKKAAAYLIKNNIQDINDIEGYFIFLKKILDTKKTVINLRGLAYKLFFEPDILAEFIKSKQTEQKKKDELEKRRIVCPCCGTYFLPENLECPECNLEVSDFTDIYQIEKHKQIVKLSPEDKKNYLSELEKIYFCKPLTQMLHLTPEKTSEEKAKIQQMENELNIKYGITG